MTTEKVEKKPPGQEGKAAEKPVQTPPTATRALPVAGSSPAPPPTATGAPARPERRLGGAAGVAAATKAAAPGSPLGGGAPVDAMSPVKDGAASGGEQLAKNGVASAAAGGAASGATGAATGGTPAGAMAGQAVQGNSDKAVNRYAGKAVAGGVDGGMQGGLHGAAIGAAKEVGLEAAKDAAKGAKKVTGGSPVAKAAEPGVGATEPKRGAGGTSYERDGGKNEESGGSKAAKAVAVGGAAAAAPPAAGLVMLMALLKWLKTMFFMAMAMLLNAGNALWALVVNIAKSAWSMVTAPFQALGGAVANAVGTVLGVTVGAVVAPIVAVTTGAASVIAVLGMLGTFFVGLFTPNLDDAVAERNPTACVITVDNPNAPGAGIGVGAQAEISAKAVFSVLSSWGMPKENIAGILGNWSQESGVDPTGVESIYTEPYSIGPLKQAAWDGNFTQIPGQAHGGIGLGQWSNGRTQLLLDYATAKNVNWHTIETQLAFMIEGDNPSDVNVFKGMLTTSQGSPGEAARYFHEAWERSADTESMVAERVADAEMWFSKMSGWQVDPNVVGAVKNIVGDLVSGIGTGASSIKDECGEALPVSGGLLGVGGYSHPVPGFAKLWGNYNEDRGSYNHAGEDFAAPLNTPILAIADGVVEHVSCAAWSGRSPCNILINHGPDSTGAIIRSLSVHMYADGVLVAQGQTVTAGQQIGKVGSNGNSTGNHLHFEIWKDGIPMDPKVFLSGVGINPADPAAPPVPGTGVGSGGNAGPAIAFAQSQLGDSYSQTVQGGCGPDYWDCSCLLKTAWAAAGKALPRTTGEQYVATTRITLGELQPGDLIFWSDNGAQSGIYHVAMYLGGGKVIHAPNPSKPVEIVNLWSQGVYGYGRVA